MNNFIYQRKTKLIFGKEQLGLLAKEIKENGSRVLLTYGQSSIKKIGLYDKVINILKENDIYFVEMGGIKPNPEVDTVRKGVALINEHNLDFILAVGGGSVIDNSKHIAISHAAKKDVWDLVCDQEQLKDVNNLIPIGTILTICATGSEMNVGGVISNPETQDKLAMGHNEAAPRFSFLDPTLLESLPYKQRVAGLCDTLSHLLELYYSSHKDDGFADRYIESLIKNIITYGKDYLHNSENYEANSQVMLTATYALNGISLLGKTSGDWNAHAIEHELSALTDFTHGIGLALIHPLVLDVYLENDLKNSKDLSKYINLGTNVFNFDVDDKDITNKTVDEIKKVFFGWLDNKVKLVDYDVACFDYSACVYKLIDGLRLSNSYHKFTRNEIEQIFEKIV